MSNLDQSKNRASVKRMKEWGSSLKTWWGSLLPSSPSHGILSPSASRGLLSTKVNTGLQVGCPPTQSLPSLSSITPPNPVTIFQYPTLVEDPWLAGPDAILASRTPTPKSSGNALLNQSHLSQKKSIPQIKCRSSIQPQAASSRRWERKQKPRNKTPI